MEEILYSKGYNNIACIDEVGRGCLAGNVVACAIVMPKDEDKIEGVTDSKKISEKKRILLYDEILEKALDIGIGEVEPEIIDKINIKEATRLAMKKAVLNLKTKPDYLLIDAEKIDLDIEQNSITKGDLRSYGIACASIIAKVYRDNKCKEWDLKYPGYNIKQHKGYGTKEHRENIIKLGPSEIHRKSFLKKIIKSD